MYVHTNLRTINRLSLHETNGFAYGRRIFDEKSQSGWNACKGENKGLTFELAVHQVLMAGTPADVLSHKKPANHSGF